MKDFRLIDTIEGLIEFATNFDSKEFSFDTEFTSLKFMKQELIGMSVYAGDEPLEKPAYIQFNFKDSYVEKEKDPRGGRKKVDVTYEYHKTDAIDFEEARPYIENMFDGAKCICANAKVEWKIFSKYGITNWQIEDDVNLMSWMLNVSTPSGLKDNTKRELKVDMPSYTDTIGMKPNNINWNKVDWYAYGEYGARDAWATWELRQVYLPKVQEFPALYKCYKSLEIPLIYEVAHSEMKGVEIDVKALKQMSKDIDVDIAKFKEEIFDKVGVEFNIGSSKQLAEMLFDRLGYPVIKKSDKTGARSCDEDTLKELAFKGHDVADDILDFRKLEKLKGTYIDAIPLMVDSDGRLRGNFNQSGTATGRFSSSQPNLQNQPNNKHYPIKSAFVPRKGYKFIVVDWSTIEIRIMAHESGDKKLVELLNAGRDIHQETTDSINKQFNLTLTRGDGKTINFAVLYLMGADSLAYTLNKELKKRLKEGTITMDEYKKLIVTKRIAQNIIDGYFNTYTGFRQFIQDETAESRNTGWVWTMGGRRRPVYELRKRETFGIGQRRTVNTIIQGGAGDLMKLGIIKLGRLYREKNYDASTLLYVHDEYVIEVKEEQAEDLLVDVVSLMENIYPPCSVPIKCDGGIYDSWAGLKQGTIKKRRRTSTVQKLKLLKLIR